MNGLLLTCGHARVHPEQRFCHTCGKEHGLGYIELDIKTGKLSFVDPIDGAVKYKAALRAVVDAFDKWRSAPRSLFYEKTAFEVLDSAIETARTEGAR